MSQLRTMLAAAAGAAAAGVVLRVHAVASGSGRPVADVIADLPGLLAHDATRVVDAARIAAADGRSATREARIEFDEQVGARRRRTKDHDA